MPSNIEFLDQNKRNILIRQFCNKHFVDFDASHNVPLSPAYFKIPTNLDRNDKFFGVGHVIGKIERKNSRDSIKTLSSISSSTEND